MSRAVPDDTEVSKSVVTFHTDTEDEDHLDAHNFQQAPAPREEQAQLAPGQDRASGPAQGPQDPELAKPKPKPRAHSIQMMVLASLLVLAFCAMIGIIIWLGVENHRLRHDDDGPALGTRILMPQWDPLTDGIAAAASGQWSTVIPSRSSASIGEVLGMQTVHAVLLPSGKIVLASGSSWRNRKDRTNTYPESLTPEGGTGLFNLSADHFLIGDAADYYSQVNNVGIFDYRQNTFYRIPHPLPSQVDPDSNNRSTFLPTDLFCTGHQHIRTGDVLFFGGTQYYFPQRTGTKTTHIFAWQKEAQTDWTQFDWTVMPNVDSPFNPWMWSGSMTQGRWYAHALPLSDGRLVVYGGFIGFDKYTPDMFPFEMNHLVEFFDSTAFFANPTQPEGAWRMVNVSDIENSPYATPLKYLPHAARACDGLTEVTSTQLRQCNSYRNDSFKLYPQTYLMPDGRIYFTREGDFNSLRGPRAECIRRTDTTYYMSIAGTRTDPSLTFTYGPQRPTNVTMSGTTVRDPNDPSKILLFGGMAMETGGTSMPYMLSVDDPLMHSGSQASQYAGSRGSRKLEVFTLPSASDPHGFWELVDPEYLGDNLDGDRTMHNALILPTKQILIVNGGNYDYFGPTKSPLLMTPLYSDDGTFLGTYSRQVLASARQPRLYHNIAILLPDATIFTSGGNAARASLDPSQSEASPDANPRSSILRASKPTRTSRWTGPSPRDTVTPQLRIGWPRSSRLRTSSSTARDARPSSRSHICRDPHHNYRRIPSVRRSRMTRTISCTPIRRIS